MIRKSILLSAVLLISIASTGCSLGTSLIGDQLDPGSVGLLVDNYGSTDERGIENAELFTGGRVTYNSLTHVLYEFPVFYQTHSFNGDNTIAFSLSGSRASVDLGVTYRFKQGPVEQSKPTYTWIHQFFRSYRVAPDVFNQSTLRNALRDCANEVVAGSNPVEFATNPTKFQPPLTACLSDKFPELDIKEVSFLNTPQLPENIQASIDKAVQAKQDAEAAIATGQKAEAEGKAAVLKAEAERNSALIRAKTEVEVNRMLSESLTPQLIELRRVENDRIRAEKGLYTAPPTIVQAGNALIPPAAAPVEAK